MGVAAILLILNVLAAVFTQLKPEHCFSQPGEVGMLLFLYFTSGSLHGFEPS